MSNFENGFFDSFEKIAMSGCGSGGYKAKKKMKSMPKMASADLFQEAFFTQLEKRAGLFDSPDLKERKGMLDMKQGRSSLKRSGEIGKAMYDAAHKGLAQGLGDGKTVGSKAHGVLGAVYEGAKGARAYQSDLEARKKRAMDFIAQKREEARET